ncbi:A/G-specific adenine glycosylase [Ectothiorhodospiraceae bacterium BW-2]|nr:A/G-specific adenine glycosylase [Ectothiorhodospiraceae bacterium BW-2]
MLAPTDTLLLWYRDHGRHDLPWNRTDSPYRIWLAEIMLQQTQVATVLDYYDRFTAQFPQLVTLAKADEGAVLALWSGLGYYRRARNLHHSAQIVQQRYGGELPHRYSALVALPGIGRSTAGAILAQAWGERYPILDGNVKRFLCRYHAIRHWPGESKIERQLWQLAEEYLPLAGQPMRHYTRALMDFGATLCRRTQPRCCDCPLQSQCQGYRQGLSAELPLPKPKPRKVREQRRQQLLLIIDARGRILLQQRPPTGVWASLWSLPQWSGSLEQLSHYLVDSFGVACDGAQPLPIVKHQLTHFDWWLEPLRLRVKGEAQPKLADSPFDYRWVHFDEIGRFGVPAPVKRLLQEATAP